MASSSGLCSRLSAATKPPYVLRIKPINVCIVFLFFEQRFKFRSADPAELRPVAKPCPHQRRTPSIRHTRAAETRFQSLSQRSAIVNCRQRQKLFALQPPIVNRILQPMRRNPRGAPAQLGQFCRWFVTLSLLSVVVVLHARLTRAPLLTLVQRQHQVVCCIAERQ